jgi:Protein of unknown function (DUF664)
MTPAELLRDLFERVATNVHGAVEGLALDALTSRIDDDTNSIAWLVWHLTRVQDDHVCEVAGVEQIWTAEGWVERFGLPFPAGATGYGQSGDDLAAVRVDADLLLGYFDAVAARTLRYVDGLVDADLDRIVDERWDPPVTLGVRLISVADDDIQHAGQAALVRGVVERR